MKRLIVRAGMLFFTTGAISVIILAWLSSPIHGALVSMAAGGAVVLVGWMFAFFESESDLL